MLWAILGIAAILILAFAIRKATANSPFVNNCGCTPNIDHLRWLEKGEDKTAAKRETFW